MQVPVGPPLAFAPVRPLERLRFAMRGERLMRSCAHRLNRAGARDLLAVAAVLVALGALLRAERRRPLRRRVEPGVARLARNGTLAALAGVVVALAEAPIVEPLARRVERGRRGLVQRLPTSAAWRDALAIVLMDYTLFLWHVLMHRWDALYRLHQVHHSDLDLDASTALRFHGAEMLASAPWRAAQVAIIGVSPRALKLWQRLTIASILFHHSNLRLPRRLERRLARFIATPRLHGIHHSTRAVEQNSNWSNGLTLWDRLHGTFRDDVAQGSIEIGVPRYRSAEEVTFARLMAMPRVPASLARRAQDGSAP